MNKKVQKAKTYIPEIQGEKDFYKSINSAIAKREDEYSKGMLLGIVKEFEEYKKFMLANMVSSSVPSDKIYKFRFTYQLMKNVWKDVEVFGDDDLENLAEYLIDEMDWDNDHLHAYFFPRKEWDGLRYWYNLLEIGSEGVENDQYPILHTDEVLISSIDYSKNPKIGFVFDFGDDHRFMMEYKGMRTKEVSDKEKTFPKVVEQKGVGPEQYPDYE
jgi:hypothetical protein